MRQRVSLVVGAFVVAALVAGCQDDTPALPPPPPVGETSSVSGSDAGSGAGLAPEASSGGADTGAAVSDASANFPTGPAVLVERGYEHPKDRVDSTGAYLPVNGKPTVVLVDAIWCPTCALTRPIFHRIRHEYQDDINLVVLDFDLREDAELARSLGAWAHPAWAVVAPDSDEVLERRFGPLNEPNLRAFLDAVRTAHAGS